MIVKAAPGLQCPKEENPRDYITDAEPVEVADSSYYRRLVDDGSLVSVIMKDEGRRMKEEKAVIS